MAVQRPSSLCGVFRGEGCEEEAGTVCVSSEDATRLLQLDASSSNAACCFYFFFFLLPRWLDGSGRLSILGPRKRANFVLEPFFATKREWSCCGGDSSSAAFTKKSMYVTSKETHTYTHSNVLLHNTSTN